jgi:hypothetical protein
MKHLLPFLGMRFFKPDIILWALNDSCSDFGWLRAVIVEARAMAQAEFAGTAPAERICRLTSPGVSINGSAQPAEGSTGNRLDAGIFRRRQTLDAFAHQRQRQALPHRCALSHPGTAAIEGDGTEDYLREIPAPTS